MTCLEAESQDLDLLSSPRLPSLYPSGFSSEDGEAAWISAETFQEKKNSFLVQMPQLNLGTTQSDY